MKSKNELRNDYAFSLGYYNWADAIDTLAKSSEPIRLDLFICGYDKIIQNESATASLAKAAENAQLWYDHDDYLMSDKIDKSSITSPNNIVTL